MYNNNFLIPKTLYILQVIYKLILRYKYKQNIMNTLLSPKISFLRFYKTCTDISINVNLKIKPHDITIKTSTEDLDRVVRNDLKLFCLYSNFHTPIKVEDIICTHNAGLYFCNLSVCVLVCN